eukprot:TRINITY_DN12347_c1_g1_i3.p1 TRINITY_DN12347_c1_g1~~TRINITY_DN12347_c1_g1_i3.p1  ORF type:complete len:562 (+),score=164.89 TRINITY_DN12347_c1_g1_i3:103-1788(+)
MSRRAQLRGNPADDRPQLPGADFFKRKKPALLGSKAAPKRSRPLPDKRPRFTRIEAQNVTEDLPLIKDYSEHTNSHMLAFEDAINFNPNNVQQPLEAWRADPQQDRVVMAHAETGAGSHFGQAERIARAERARKAYLARNPDQRPLPTLEMREADATRYVGNEHPDVSKGKFRFFALRRQADGYHVTPIDKWYAMSKARKMVTLSTEEASEQLDKPAPISSLLKRMQQKIQEEQEYEQSGLAVTTDDKMPEDYDVSAEVVALRKAKRGMTADEQLAQNEVDPDNDPDLEDIDNVEDGFNAASDDEEVMDAVGDINQRSGYYDTAREQDKDDGDDNDDSDDEDEYDDDEAMRMLKRTLGLDSDDETDPESDDDDNDDKDAKQAEATTTNAMDSHPDDPSPPTLQPPSTTAASVTSTSTAQPPQSSQRPKTEPKQETKPTLEVPSSSSTTNFAPSAVAARPKRSADQAAPAPKSEAQPAKRAKKEGALSNARKEEIKSIMIKYLKRKKLTADELAKTLKKKGVAKGADAKIELKFVAATIEQIATKSKNGKKTFWDLKPEYRK